MRPHLATLVEDFRRHGSEPAVVVHRGVRAHAFTYGALADLSYRFAAELIRRNIAPGERVVLWGHNSAEWIGAFFGCVLRGVLAVPLDAAGDVAFALRVIADTKPRLLVADRALLPRLAAALPPPEAHRAADFPFLVLEDLALVLPHAANNADLQEAGLGPDTPLQIIFTSGATSEPKGIVHTHRNVLASLDPIEREMQKYLRYERIVHPLRFLHTLPLSHVFGQFMGLWVPPLMAAEVHFESRLQAPHLLELIRRHQISVLAAVPRVLDLLRQELLARHPDLTTRLDSAHGASLWRKWWMLRDVHRALGLKFWALVCGGAALPGAVESFWRDLGLAVIQGYGMTETAALITLNHPLHPAQGSLGKPLPGREVRIGSDGEVLVRGEMVSNTRWQNGRITTLSDPWLVTGDIVEQDAEGQLRFRGRKGETIVTAAGLNIHPEDVEAALNRQPGMEASAVVPLHESSGPEPVAVVVFRGSAEQLAAAIVAANASLAEYQRIRRWIEWPEFDLPRTSLGKIQRHKITQWVATQMGGPHLPTVGKYEDETAAPDRVGELFARIAGRDLSLDSLGRVQLQAELEERMGVSLSDEQLQKIQTAADLRAGLHAGAAAQSGPGDVGAPMQPSEPPRYRYPEWTWWAPVQVLRLCFQTMVMRPLVWLLGAPKVSSPAMEAPREPMLIVANHVTFFDPALILYALPWAVRKKVAVAMAAHTLEDLRHGRNQGHWFLDLVAPLGYWAITVLFNVFPLPSGAGFRRSFSHAGWAMDHGYHVLIFPEGVRSPGVELLPFRSGIGLLARESGASILPVAMIGLGELKQRPHGWFHWSWFRSGRLKLRIGEPVAPNPSLSPQLLAESVRNKLASLLQASD